jgi:aminoglycoside phosphotransferase (APT) family kinase protein
VKTPRAPESGHAIEAEWKVVAQLNEGGTTAGLVPKPVGDFEVDGARFYAYQGIGGRTMLSRFRDRVLLSRVQITRLFCRQALGAALQVHGLSTRPSTGDFLAADLMSSFAALRTIVPHLPAAIAEMANAGAETLATASVPFPVGRIHGDFSPYNLLTRSLFARECAGLIDWEHSEPDRPQYLDVFRFIAACELMGRKTRDDGQALERMSNPHGTAAICLWRPWLQAMAPALAADDRVNGVHRALWTHYWICAAFREQQRQADPADLSQCTYLRGLLELAR